MSAYTMDDPENVFSTLPGYCNGRLAAIQAKSHSFAWQASFGHASEATKACCCSASSAVSLGASDTDGELLGPLGSDDAT